jgi:glycolate oxidase iron-sulfur subunit
LAKITKCAKCGACTAPCPLYKISGKETLTARARLHLLSKLDNTLSGSEPNPELSNGVHHPSPSLNSSDRGAKKHSQAYNEIFSKCLLCGACYQACPRDINTPELIVKARENGAGTGGLASFKKLLIRKSLSSPSLIPHTAGAIQAFRALAERVLPEESGLRIKLSLFKSEHPAAKKSFIQSIRLSPHKTHTARVAYFPGCLANYLKQDIAAATGSCLKRLCRTEMVAPAEQTCCGMAAYAAGDKKEALSLAKKNIAAFGAPPYADLPIFTSCATCYTHLRSYRELFKSDQKWHAKAESFSQRVCEFSSFLLTNITVEFQFTPAPSNKENVFYHDPCHLRFLKNQGKPIVDAPRSLLTKVPGVTLIELPDGPQCCGHGGLFNITYPEDSRAICSSLLSSLFTTEADTVVTTCSGCLMQIQENLARLQSSIKVRHLAVFLNAHLGPLRLDELE